MSSKETDTILSFINQMLMEEEDDLENNKPYSLALQETEQSLYEAINNPHQQSPSNANPFDHDHDQNHFIDPHHSSEQIFSKIHGEDVLPFIQKSKKNASRFKERDITKDSVDLRSLLMQCAEAIADLDSQNVSGLMLKIRRHSSPHGTAAERVAHYFANALEARMAGNGTALSAPTNMQKISGVDVLKGHKMLITAVPFLTMTHLLGNGTVMAKVASEVPATLHILDFGIMFGFQWPSLILALSEIPGGPPKLRITGIDFPQPGMKECLLDTGARLAEYCRKLRVPFEYNGIVQTFETIRLEDLMIEKGEMVVVNSVNRLQNVTDIEDAVNLNVPRDDVLNLIRRIDPDMFVHSVINGTHNTPFFVARVREAFFHFSAMFDMFEAAVPLEEEDQGARARFEDYVLGRSILSVVGCEGTNRERPETYKKWQVRTVRAGFRQIPVDEDIVKRVRVVREDYHDGFSVGEDGMWILLEWKGRVIRGVSCWQPVRV